MNDAERNEPVRSEVRDAVLEIRIARPDKRNALTLAMYSALAAALEQAERDDPVRAILLRGSRDCFTAGNDLHDFLHNPPRDENSPVLRFLRTLSRVQKPLLAAVDGAAVGIGTTLLLHCDLVYAGAGAVFQLPFVNLGLVPEAASSLLLPQRLGHARAAELLLLGEPFDADKALAYGLINGVYPAGELLDAARAKARRLAAQPAAALRLSKQLMKRATAGAIEETIGVEGRHFIERLNSAEAQAALRAFLEKRRPEA